MQEDNSTQGRSNSKDEYIEQKSVRELARKFTSTPEAQKDKTIGQISSSKAKEKRLEELRDEIKDRQSSRAIKGYYETMEEIHKECETFRSY